MTNLVIHIRRKQIDRYFNSAVKCPVPTLMIVPQFVKQSPVPRQEMIPIHEVGILISVRHDRIPRMHITGTDLHVGNNAFRACVIFINSCQLRARIGGPTDPDRRPDAVRRVAL